MEKDSKTKADFLEKLNSKLYMMYDIIESKSHDQNIHDSLHKIKIDIQNLRIYITTILILQLTFMLGISMILSTVLID
jgi:hypothetical protein